MITIYHNPNCGTSRKVLTMLEEAGHRPKVIEYLKHPLDYEELEALVKKMGVSARDILRDKGDLYEELELGIPGLPDRFLLEAIEEHPSLMNRPIVITPKGAKLCRPAETVQELL
ncbi:arsenate reductase (glutaredoxin) [bacterium]|nr:arsenate reductase (glutaredoxin) [bacterium]